MAEILEGLLQLGEAESALLASAVTFGEVTSAVQQLNCGWSSGVDGLPVEFHFGRC